MVNHTPRSWRHQEAIPEGEWQIVDAEDDLMGVAFDEPRARFIAAAPDMERALEAMVKIYGTRDHFFTVTKDARVALAKARGE